MVPSGPTACPPFRLMNQLSIDEGHETSGTPPGVRAVTRSGAVRVDLPVGHHGHAHHHWLSSSLDRISPRRSHHAAAGGPGRRGAPCIVPGTYRRELSHLRVRARLWFAARHLGEIGLDGPDLVAQVREILLELCGRGAP